MLPHVKRINVGRERERQQEELYKDTNVWHVVWATTTGTDDEDGADGKKTNKQKT